MVILWVCFCPRLMYGAWVVSNEPPPGFESIVNTQRVDIFFQGGKIGSGEVKTGTGDMTLSDVRLSRLENSGLKSEYVHNVVAKLEQTNTPQNSEYLCKDYKNLILTYKDICEPVLTSDVELILNQNNQHLYIFVNPNWIDTRSNNKPEILEDSTVGLSYSLYNKLHYSYFKYSRSKAHETITLSQDYGISLGNTSWTGELYMNQSGDNDPVWGLQNIQGITHNKGRYYQAGMLSMPQINNITRHQFLGIMTGQDYRTVDIGSSQGTPVVLSITTPSEIVIQIKNTQQIIHSTVLYPGTQQVDTSRFPSGVYMIDIMITDITGTTKKISRLYIKNTNIPVEGHPRYSTGIGWLSNRKTKKLGIFNVNDYEFDTPSLFFAMHVATGHQGYLSLGALNYKKHVVSSALQTVFGSHYIYTASALASTGGSAGVGFTLNYTPYPYLYFYNQILKTWAGTDDFIQNRYEANSTVRYSLNLSKYDVSFLFSLESEEEDKLTEKYSVNVSRDFNILDKNDLHSSLLFDSGYDKDQGAYAMLYFVLGYSSGKDFVQFLTEVGTQNQGVGGMQFLPSLRGRFYRKKNDHYFMAATNVKYREQAQANGLMAYGNRWLQTDVSANATPDTKSFSSSASFGVAGNRKSLFMTGSDPTSGILVDVISKKRIPYTVVINKLASSQKMSNRQNFIPLSPFQTYSVSIVPLSISVVAPQKNYTTTLYPGNIESLKVTLQQTTIMVTQLVDDKGAPIAGASHTNKDGALSMSNDQGYIQFTAIENQQYIDFKMKNTKSCRVDLPPYSGEQVVYTKSMLCH